MTERNSFDGPTSGLAVDSITVDAQLRKALQIEHVVALNGPMLRNGVALASATLNVTARFPEHGIEVRLAYQAKGGRRVLRSVLSITNYRRKEVQASDLQKLRFTEVEAEIDRILAHEEAQADDSFTASFEAFLNDTAPRPGRGHSAAKLDLLRIAVLYASLAHEADPYPVMAEKLGISAASCRNEVSKARKAGLLEPTIRGRRNHRFTQKAKDMLLNLYDNNGDT